MKEPLTAEEHQAAIAKEYGQYVAVSTIYIGGARAFNTGDPVPASHVSGGVVPQELVARSTTKAAQAASEKG